MQRVVDGIVAPEDTHMATDDPTVLPAFQPICVGSDLDRPPYPCNSKSPSLSQCSGPVLRRKDIRITCKGRLGRGAHCGTIPERVVDVG